MSRICLSMLVSLRKLLKSAKSDLQYNERCVKTQTVCSEWYACETSIAASGDRAVSGHLSAGVGGWCLSEPGLPSGTIIALSGRMRHAHGVGKSQRSSQPPDQSGGRGDSQPQRQSRA